MSKLIERTERFQLANQQLAGFVTSGIMHREIVNMTEFEVARQEFESMARSINYYVNMYEERIVNAPTKYAQNAIDIFQSRYQQTSLAYSDLLSTITSTMAFFHDVTTVWNETRYVKTVFRNYVEDKSNMKRFVATVCTSDEFNEHVNILQRFCSEISTRSFDILSKLYVYRQRHLDMWKTMVEESTLFQFYRALHDDVISPSSQTNATILSVFTSFVGQNEIWLLSNWEKLNVYINADLAAINHTSKVAEIKDAFMEAEQILDVTNTFGNVDDRFFDIIREIQDYMHNFLLENIIGESFYK